MFQSHGTSLLLRLVHAEARHCCGCFRHPCACVRVCACQTGICSLLSFLRTLTHGRAHKTPRITYVRGRSRFVQMTTWSVRLLAESSAVPRHLFGRFKLSPRGNSCRYLRRGGQIERAIMGRRATVKCARRFRFRETSDKPRRLQALVQRLVLLPYTNFAQVSVRAKSEGKEWGLAKI